MDNRELPLPTDLAEFQTVVASSISREALEPYRYCGAFVMRSNDVEGNPIVEVIKQDYDPESQRIEL